MRNLFLILSISLLLVGCSSENISVEEPNGSTGVPKLEDQVREVIEVNLTSSQRIAVEGVNDLGFRLFEDLRLYNQSDKQIGFSPLSVINVIAQMANGASSEDLDHITDLLNISGTPEEKLEMLNDLCNVLNTKLPYVDREAYFNFTNSLWHDPRLVISSSYKKCITDYFAGCVIDENPAGFSGQQKINQWVNEATKGLIPQFLEEPILSRVTLLNTLYFKGGWQQTFSKDKTELKDFHNADGSTTKTEFMQGVLYARVSEADGWQLVSLPIGSGKYEMSFILPANEQQNDILPVDVWKRLIGSRHLKEILLNLPKFNISGGSDLFDTLNSLSNGYIASTKFTNILEGREPLELEMVLHKLKIEIDEEGVEGAAATLAGLLTSSGEAAPEPLDISIDHKFYFVLQEKSTDALIFMGSIDGF